MKERPILFSGPMVRAILEGRKTQTRRIVKPQPHTSLNDGEPCGLGWHTPKVTMERWQTAETFSKELSRHCPYGKPGDRLWVRETFADVGWPPTGPQYVYRADPDSGDNDVQKWRPSLFMPRAASRITLEVVSVRVERLNAISEEDAKAEGAEEISLESQESINETRYGPGLTDNGYYPEVSYAEGYQRLWESINGPGSWNANPWVWVVEFAPYAAPDSSEGAQPIAVESPDTAGRGLTEREINHIQKFSLDFCDKYATTFSSHDRVAIIIHLREAIAKFIGDHGYLSQQGRPDLPSGEPVAWMDNKGWTMADREKRKLPQGHEGRWHIPLYRSAPEVDALKVDSTTLIGDVKERWRQLRERGEDGPHALTEDPWRSFYGGWLEGRADLLKFIRSRPLSGPSGSGEETTKPNE